MIRHWLQSLALDPDSGGKRYLISTSSMGLDYRVLPHLCLHVKRNVEVEGSG